jgi:uncharacterized protein (TIGR02145 family)
MKAIKLATFIFLGFLCSGYSQETGTVTDIEGNVYKTVQIGNQWWMAENLKVTHYSNGDIIPNITDVSEWISLSTGAYCNYDNDEANVTTYGRLYNWYAVNDRRGLALVGWHVPSDAEWKQLEIYLGMSQSEADGREWRGTDEGGKLKEAGLIHWSSPNTGATNESGFSALPGGYRSVYDCYNNCFNGKGCSTNFWSSTEDDGSSAWRHALSCFASGVLRYSNNKLIGYSVRCVKDQGSGDIESKSVTPKLFELNQNYPNPFNSETVISYNLPSACHVKLNIYNIRGEEIATLFDGHKLAGFHSITWRAKNISNGLYFYKLQADNMHFVKKMIFQK